MSRRRRVLIAALAALLAGGAAAFWQVHRHQQATGHLDAARSDLEHHHYESARQHALAAAEYWPHRGDVRLLAARACRRAEHPDEARPHLAAARDQLGETDDVRLEQQLIPVQKGESEFIESALRRRAEIDPEHRELILEALAAGQLSTFRIDQARATLVEWLKEQHDDPRPFFWHGLALEQMAGYQEDAAMADYRKAIDLDPDFDEARRRLGKLLLKKKMIVDARAQYETLVKNHPNDAAALVGLGQVKIAQGETDSGRELLQRAVQIDPSEADGSRELGSLLLDEDRSADALPLLQKACKLQPQDPYASHSLTQCLRRLKRDKEADAEQARYDRLAANQARALKLLGELQQKPKDAALLHELGALYLEGGRPEYEQTGLWLLQRALQVDPSRAETLKLLANYFDRKGKPEIATQLRQRMQ
jgi:Tfp pilus assembly protein PilF